MEDSSAVRPTGNNHPGRTLLGGRLFLSISKAWRAGVSRVSYLNSSGFPTVRWKNMNQLGGRTKRSRGPRP